MIKRLTEITTRTCDKLAVASAGRPERQQQIAARAFELWLARGFRNGSPQEDWLQAQRELQRTEERAS